MLTTVGRVRLMGHVAAPHGICYQRVYRHRRKHGQREARPSSGTLDLMALRTLDALGPLHGYGIARRIEQVSGNEVLLN